MKIEAVQEDLVQSLVTEVLRLWVANYANNVVSGTMPLEMNF